MFAESVQSLLGALPGGSMTQRGDHWMHRWLLGALSGLSILFVGGCVNATATKGASAWNSATLGDGGVSEFYAFEGELPETPGTIPRSEPLDERQALRGAADNVRLLYTSTEGLGGSAITAVSGVLYLPRGDAPEGGWPLMAWTHGTVGIADICAPSWDGRQQQDMDYLNFWLGQGVAVVASDYQGLGTPGTHPYLATRPAAYSNLDIIRAVQGAGYPVSSGVVVIGQSQGAGAAVATASYAPDYAPDVDIRGVVATGVPYFSPAALVALNESRPPDQPDPMLAYNFLAMTLAEQIEPGFLMREYVSDEAWPIVSMVTNACHKEMRARTETAGLSYNRAFKQTPSDVLGRVFAQMGFPDMSIAAPIFLGTGARDRDTPQHMQAAFMRDACAAGTVVGAHLYTELDHKQVVPGSTGESLTFVQAVFAGDAIKGNCDASPLG